MRRTSALVVLAALWAGAPTAPADDKEKKVDEGKPPVTATLEGKLHVHEPVPLAGPFPALLRTAKVGDRVLLQVAYAPQGSVVPKKVTARAENPAVSVLEVLATEHQLVMLKPDEAARGKAGNYFAVLVKANAEGECSVVLTCAMSDGGEKKVPFQFKVEK